MNQQQFNDQANLQMKSLDSNGIQALNKMQQNQILQQRNYL